MGSRDAGLDRVMTTSDTATPDLGRFGYFGISSISRPGSADRKARLWHDLDRRFAARRAVVRRAAFGSDDHTEGGHRHRQHLDGGCPARRRVIPPHRRRLPGRFVLGIGVGHPEVQGQYRKPYEALVSYLDELDEYGVPANQRVLAAQGPRVLRLSAERTAGAHPANVRPNTPHRLATLSGRMPCWRLCTTWCCPPTPRKRGRSRARGWTTTSA